MKRLTLFTVLTSIVMLASCSKTNSNDIKNDNGIADNHSDNFMKQYINGGDIEDDYTNQEAKYTATIVIPDSPDDDDEVATRMMMDEFNREAGAIKAATVQKVNELISSGDTDGLDIYKNGHTIRIGEDSGDVISSYLVTALADQLIEAGTAEIKLSDDYSVEYVHFFPEYIDNKDIYGIA